MFRKLNKSFVSAEDLFLEKLRSTLKESPSQHEERVRHESLAQQRDEAHQPSIKDS